MKYFTLILSLSLLVGCAIPSPGSAALSVAALAKSDVPAASQTVDINPAHAVARTIESPISAAQPEVVQPAPARVKVFHFTYTGPSFTHWVLESSTNLIDWENCDAVVQTTDTTNSIDFLTTDKAQEFYRIAGDTI